MMGTSTPINRPAVNLSMTPEDCSAEILRTLFGYLPEKIRNSDQTGTVITVPAAFNQMQKDATMAAAQSAGHRARRNRPQEAVITRLVGAILSSKTTKGHQSAPLRDAGNDRHQKRVVTNDYPMITILKCSRPRAPKWLIGETPMPRS
jgi:hypothetical protein